MLFTTSPPLAGAENRLLSYRLALRRVNSRAFIWWHTVIFGADTPRRRGLTPRAATPSFDAPPGSQRGALFMSF
nr:MAG TPA: hypothetical protein [Myoviridae sp. ct5FH28]